MTSQATTPTDIADFGLSVSDDWYPVDLDGLEKNSAWAKSLVASVGAGSNAAAITAHLDSIRYRLAVQGDPYLSAAVFLPRADQGIVDCLLTYRISELGPDDTPEAFLSEAESQRGRAEPGLVVREVSTWQGSVAVGDLVGARTLNSYHDLGEERGWLEERTIFAVYPPGARQSVVLTFTTPYMDAFSDMPAETGAIVATLSVDLVAAS